MNGVLNNYLTKVSTTIESVTTESTTSSTEVESTEVELASVTTLVSTAQDAKKATDNINKIFFISIYYFLSTFYCGDIYILKIKIV